MRRWSVLVAFIVIVTLIAGCGRATPTAPTAESTSAPETGLAIQSSPLESGESAKLTPNPVETSMPQYGGSLRYGYYWIRSFDPHQRVGWGPQVTLPIFNQLVMFDINYRQTGPQTIIGDLAERWEISQDGTEIIFYLHQGINWHDGVPFTADDVIYSLDKMADPKRSVISSWFPAYEKTEKLDDYIVKVHLKYASAGFMLALAQGESEILPYHLNGTNDQSAEFLVGTGPFMIQELKLRVFIKYKRNPEYWKKDKYGNQLPYLDGLEYDIMDSVTANQAVISRQLDFKGPVTGASDADTYKILKNGAPELLWQRRDRYNGYPINLNTSKPPLNDVRVRRAIGLVMIPEDMVIGFSQDVAFGLPGVGLLHPSYGLPKDEVAKIMGWDKPYDERVAQAKQLLADAGYPDGLDLTFMTGGGNYANATLVLADELHKTLNINAQVESLAEAEYLKRIKNNDYMTWMYSVQVTEDVSQLATYFSSSGVSNWSHYSNPELDKLLAELDQVLDPTKRQEMIWRAERILLTDLPALPTGIFPPNLMPYYPYVKNLRWNYNSYSNICRLEDVWIDKSLQPSKPPG